MSIVKVTFHDWNGNDRVVDVTSDDSEALKLCKTEEDMMMVAIKYVKRRWTECVSIISVEIIAN